MRTASGQGAAAAWFSVPVGVVRAHRDRLAGKGGEGAQPALLAPPGAAWSSVPARQPYPHRRTRLLPGSVPRRAPLFLTLSDAAAANLLASRHDTEEDAVRRQRAEFPSPVSYALDAAHAAVSVSSPSYSMGARLATPDHTLLTAGVQGSPVKSGIGAAAFESTRPSAMASSVRGRGRSIFEHSRGASPGPGTYEPPAATGPNTHTSMRGTPAFSMRGRTAAGASPEFQGHAGGSPGPAAHNSGDGRAMGVQSFTLPKAPTFLIQGRSRPTAASPARPTSAASAPILPPSNDFEGGLARKEADSRFRNAQSCKFGTAPRLSAGAVSPMRCEGRDKQRPTTAAADFRSMRSTFTSKSSSIRGRTTFGSLESQLRTASPGPKYLARVDTLSSSRRVLGGRIGTSKRSLEPKPGPGPGGPPPAVAAVRPSSPSFSFRARTSTATTESVRQASRPHDRRSASDTGTGTGAGNGTGAAASTLGKSSVSVIPSVNSWSLRGRSGPSPLTSGTDPTVPGPGAYGRLALTPLPPLKG